MSLGDYHQVVRPAVSEADKAWYYNMHQKVLSKEFVSVQDWKRYSDLHMSLYLERRQLLQQQEREDKQKQFLKAWHKHREAELQLTEQKKHSQAHTAIGASELNQSQVIPQHEPGAKLDQGKLLPHTVLGAFASALNEVVKVGTFGAIKYTENGWLSVPNGVNRYANASERHRLTIDLEGFVSADTESTIMHLAHKIWNDLAVLTLLLNSGAVSPADTSRVIEAAKKLAVS